jgi:hypothetical protein
MRGDVYALLVGIDDYEPPVPKLGGCGNDVEAIHELLGCSSVTGSERWCSGTWRRATA